MKKLLTLFVAAGMIASVNPAFALAQRGQGRGPSSAPAVPNIPQASPARGSQNRGGPSAAPNPRQRPDSPQGKKPESSVSTEITQNPKLAERLQGMLPPDMTLDEAAAGFKNRGLFIAALNVSKNLKIPFTDIRDRMTGDDPSSLGDTIHELRPDMASSDVESEVEKAEKQAKDLEESGD